jgi:hypothetical protein
MNPNGVCHLFSRVVVNRTFRIVLNLSIVRFLIRINDSVQEFVSYYGKNTTAAELASKILSSVDDFKKA